MNDIKPYPKNAPGCFIVADSYCIQCCAPQTEAPDLMDNDDTSCYFSKQPRTPDEVDRAIKAVCVSCCGAVRYVAEEHTVVDVDGTVALRTGDRVRVVTGHCCETVNLHDRLLLVEDETILEIWPTMGRGPGGAWE